jgi:hypothetical protein
MLLGRKTHLQQTILLRLGLLLCVVRVFSRLPFATGEE